MLVNEAFVRRFFPGERLIGRTVSLTAHTSSNGDVPLGRKTIVGIVRDTVYNSIREPATPTFYKPLAQREIPLFIPVFSLAIRPETESPVQITNGIRAVVNAIEPDLKPTFRPMSDRVNAALAQDRLVARLSLFGGGFALLLAAVGLYGVTANGVACRRSELGIRMALGSAPAGVVRLVVWETLRLVGAGIAVGIVVSLWSGQFIASLLYGVAPADPLIVSVAALALSIVGTVAAWLPAHRHRSRIPRRVLRQTS